MSIPQRTQLVPLPPCIKSSYPIGSPRSKLLAVASLPNGADLVPPDVRDAIVALHEAVSIDQGDFRVTDCRRDVPQQAAARKKYENWLAAGKPAKGSPGYKKSSMKPDFVSKPGFSWHNAGRAVDLDLGNLNFVGVPADLQLDKLWVLAKKIGWRPVIKAADEGASEAWHFDYMGEWEPVYDRLGYKDAAMCACLDIGVAAYGRDKERLIQAQLQRAGYDIGEIDGWIGARTHRGIEQAGLELKQVLADPSLLFVLPSSRKVKMIP